MHLLTGLLDDTATQAQPETAHMVCSGLCPNTLHPSANTLTAHWVHASVWHALRYNTISNEAQFEHGSLS